MRTKLLVLLPLLLVASPAKGQNVLVYDALPSGELMWYSGFAGLAITTVDEAMWSAMTQAQFESYDLIWIGGVNGLGSAGAVYNTLDMTKATWSPAVTGRITVTSLHVAAGIHPVAGAMTFVDDVITWLLASPAGTTSLYVGQDTGADSFGFLSLFGVSGCAGTDCFNTDAITITMPGHPAMANSTDMSLSNWNQTVHNRILGAPPIWDILNQGPGGELITIAREFEFEIVTPCLPCAFGGSAYSTRSTSLGGIAPFNFSVQAPTMLPPGLSIDAATGIISGTLNLPGPYSFTIEVSDSSVPPQMDSQAYVLDLCPSNCSVGLCGDCDGSGAVTIVDPFYAAKFSAGLATFPSASQFDSCNVFGELAPAASANITMGDALVIAQSLVGLRDLTCCAGGAKLQIPLPCGGSYCGGFSADDATADLSDYATTHYFSLANAPPARFYRITVTGAALGNMDLYVGAMGTPLGDEMVANYSYSSTGPGNTETVIIDNMSAPFNSINYVGSDIAIAVKSVVADSYTLSIECLCEPIDISMMGTYVGDTTGLPDNSNGLCAIAVGPDMAFDYTTSAVTDLVITTDNPGTFADTILYVTAAGCTTPLATIACDDDGGTGTTSTVSLPFSLPATYTIIVDTKFGGGPFELTVAEVPSIGCPNTEGVIPAAGPFPHVIMDDTTAAINDSSVPCGPNGSDHVYLFTPAVSGTYRFDTCGGAVQTSVVIRENECIAGMVVGCDTAGPPECFDGADVTVSLTAGTTYNVVVDGTSAPYTLTVDAIGLCGATVDDTLPTMLPLTYMNDTTGADNSYAPGCGVGAGPDHILELVPDTSGSFDFDTCGSSFDTILEVFDVDCHGAEKQKGDLRLDTPEGIRAGGKSGPVIVAGNHEESYLFELISLPEDDADVMPPKGKPLSEAQVSWIRGWIREGAALGDGVAWPQPEGAVDTGLAIDALTDGIGAPDAGAVQTLQNGGVIVRNLSTDGRLLEVDYSHADRAAGDLRLEELAPLARNIHTLDLKRTRISDDDLAALAGMTNLRILHLQRTKISDAAIPHLASLNNLESLNLYNTQVSDESLPALKRLTSLKKIYLWSTQVTSDGARDLAATLTSAEVNMGE